MSISHKTSSMTLIIIYINVALYAICFQLQRPIEPFMVENLNLTGDAVSEYARLQSFFSILQTIGSLIFGSFIDKFGVKGGFIISFLASAACYGLLACATTIPLLYLSKVPSIFQAGFLCAQVAASQITPDGKERVTALGRLTMAYTVGSVLGPAIGGWLGASGNYYFSAKLAVAGSLFSVFLTMFMQINNTSDTENKKSNEKKESIYTVPNTWQIINSVRFLLATKLISGFANSMSVAAFPLIVKNDYHLTEQYVGLSMAIMSGINAVFNGFLIHPILSAFDGNLLNAIKAGLLIMCAMFMLQSFFAIPSLSLFYYLASQFPVYSTALQFLPFYITSIVLGICQFLISTILTSESTTRVGPLSKGTLLGVEHSLFAAARIITPQIGVYLLKFTGLSGLSGVCGMIFFGISAMWYLSEVPLASGVTVNERKER